MKNKDFSWSKAAGKAVYGVNSFQSTGYAVDPNDLEALQTALDRWGQFLRNIFVESTNAKISPDRVSQLSLEDTELFLDVKIQLSQILSPIQDDILANRLDMICNNIRKDSYQFLATTLRELGTNDRQMEEIGNHAGLMEFPGSQSFYSNTPGAGNSGIDSAQNDIELRRKQLMVTINRQHRDVLRNMAQLNNRIANTLHPEESEF